MEGAVNQGYSGDSLSEESDSTEKNDRILSDKNDRLNSRDESAIATYDSEKKDSKDNERNDAPDINEQVLAHISLILM